MGFWSRSLYGAGGEEWEELAEGGATSPPAGSLPVQLVVPHGGALHPSLGEMGLVKDPSSPFPHPVLGSMGYDVSN